MANESVNNIKNVLRNPTSRVMLILTVSVVGVSLVVANVLGNSKQQRPADLAAQASVGGAPAVSSVPGTSNSARHNELVQEANRRKAQEALETGGSAVPRLTANPDPNQKDPFDLISKRPEESAPGAGVIPVAPVAQNQAPAQRPVAEAQPQREVVAPKVKRPIDERQVEQAMAGLLASWTPTGQGIETDHTGKGAPMNQGGQQGAQSGSYAPAGGQMSQASRAAQTQGASASAVAVKAGTILHAVIVTSVNTDEPGPVMAEIVSGPFAGARLLGSFELPENAQNVVLKFNTLSAPSMNKSVPINTFAIEPNTARTALSSEVDNHYAQRYGVLMGAALLKGYARAISQSGSTQTTTIGLGGIGSTTTFPTLDAKKTNRVALGEVGSELSSAMKGSFNRPPTVTLNSGTPVGILFMKDVSFE